MEGFPRRVLASTEIIGQQSTAVISLSNTEYNMPIELILFYCYIGGAPVVYAKLFFI